MGVVKYTYDNIVEEALKYKRRVDFKKYAEGYYNAALRNGLIDDICKHMISKIKYTKENVLEEARKYNSKLEFRENSLGAYMASFRLGISDKAFAHMIYMKDSVPQKICNIIFDELLNLIGDYNNRTAISPYEIDVYYNELKFGIEYNGYVWHSVYDRKDIDNNKKIIADKLGIKIFYIKPDKSFVSRGVNDDISFIKQYIKNNLEELKSLINVDITEYLIDHIDIPVDKLYTTLSIDRIESELEKYYTIEDLKKNNVKLYSIMRRRPVLSEIYKKFYEKSRKNVSLERKRRLLEKRENEKNIILEKIKKEYSNFQEFIKNKELVKKCRNYKMMKFIKKNIFNNERIKKKKTNVMKKAECQTIKNMTTEDIILYSKTFSSYEEVRNNYTLYEEIKKRNLNLLFRTYFNNGKSRRGTWMSFSDADITEFAKVNYKTRKELLKNKALYIELGRRGIRNSIFLE